MENGYEKLGAYIGVPIALLIIGGFFLYHFTIYVLPWIILIAVVVAAIWFFFWQRSTRRSPHPWD
jgi:hypothetical protein